MITQYKTRGCSFCTMAMAVLSLAGIILIIGTLTSSGQTAVFNLALGVTALAAATACAVVAWLYEPSLNPRGTIELADFSLAGFLVWLVVAAISFSEAASLPYFGRGSW